MHSFAIKQATTIFQSIEIIMLEAKNHEVKSKNFSEMISPTMMMETEVDTDTDTIEETDNDKNNIYEEVLNNETYRRRHNHSKLSVTSSISSLMASIFF